MAIGQFHCKSDSTTSLKKSGSDWDFFQSYAKLALIACIIASINPFVYTGMETPSMFAWALENKFYAAMMIFFLCNALETQLVSTGAFEISVDNMPVWSKIDSGRIPQPPELFQIIDTHLKLNTGQDPSMEDIL